MTVRVKAPGRVNLLGEHTDYAGGLCLPVAIDRYVEVEADLRPKGVRIQTELGAIEIPRVQAVEPRWAAYVMGCAEALGIEGGFELRVAGNLPMGKGLGSSGAYTVAVTAALARLFELKPDLVAAAREGERRTGVNCGVLDQSASVYSKAGHALLLDVGQGTREHVPFSGRLAVVHTGSDHELASSGYNDRVREWQEGERLLKIMKGELTAVPEPLRRRLQHIQDENGRVRLGVECLQADDLAGFGRLMFESHESLSELCEVSTAELDKVVGVARESGALGAKLTGAGFGGAVVILLGPDTRLPFKEIYSFCSSDGVRQI